MEIRKGLDIKNLPVEHAVQKLWGSQLQDLSLLDSLNVNLSKASLFGGQGAPQELMRPIGEVAGKPKPKAKETDPIRTPGKYKLPKF